MVSGGTDMEEVHLCVVSIHERAGFVPFRVLYAPLNPAPAASTAAPCPCPRIELVLTPVLSSIPTGVIMTYTRMSASKTGQKCEVNDSGTFEWDVLHRELQP